jgi:hypothetical protein
LRAGRIGPCRGLDSCQYDGRLEGFNYRMHSRSGQRCRQRSGKAARFPRIPRSPVHCHHVDGALLCVPLTLFPGHRRTRSRPRPGRPIQAPGVELSRFARSRGTVTRAAGQPGRWAGAGAGAPCPRAGHALRWCSLQQCAHGADDGPSVYPVRYPLVAPAGILPRRCPVAGTRAPCKIVEQACDLRKHGWS